MIYTITFNPALDYISQVENFETGKINRTKTEKILPGGKGLNVSTVLKNLGIESIALGFIAGFTGEELKRNIEEKGIKTDFINVEKGITRINVKISSNKETALNGNGPEITEEDINKLLEKIEKITKEDMVILAGNIPRCINNDIYEIICKTLEKNNVTFVVDATKELLMNVLKYKPFLIKPNNHELAEMFNVELNSTEDVVFYARKLKEMGAQNVLISMGKDGALLVTENDEVFASSVAKGEVINSVGAGDSMVAGFIAGYLKSNSYEEALRLGAASGGATAFSSDLATREFIDKLVDEIKIEKIK